MHACIHTYCLCNFHDASIILHICEGACLSVSSPHERHSPWSLVWYALLLDSLWDVVCASETIVILATKLLPSPIRSEPLTAVNALSHTQ
jgi:hypothetical protein